MTTYVLVPGFWLGGWAWDDVAARLREEGHEVHAVTPAGTTVADHVDQLTGLLGALTDVVLVGHSCGGLVVTAAADRMPDRIRRLVYVDTGPLPSGMSQADFDGVPPESDGGLVPVAAVAPAVVHERGTPQPVATATDPVHHTGAWRRVPRTGILCSFSEERLRGLAATVPAFALMAGEGWTYAELDADHWPMFSAPQALAALLLSGACVN